MAQNVPNPERWVLPIFSSDQHLMRSHGYDFSTNYWYAYRPDVTNAYGNFFESEYIPIENTNGLEAWFPYPAPYTSTQYDFSVRHTNNLTVVGTTWATNGIHFNGIDDYLYRDSMSLNGLTGITISAWIYMELGSSDLAMRIVDDRAVDGVIFFLNNTNSSTPNSISLLVDTVTGGHRQEVTVYTTYFPTNRWMQLAATYNGNDIIIYVNSYAQPTTIPSAGTGNIVDGGAQFNIGRSPSAVRNLKGYMDDLKIYRYALSPQSITNDYQNNKLKYGYPP